MGQPGFGGALDTPRTNIGDATYLRQPDFADISQEASFQSPGKDGNFLQQLRNGRSNGVNLRTPRQRGPLADRQNLPPSVGGAEFTPLLKSATRNSVRRHGKENTSAAAVPNTPALGRIDEDDMTPLPRMDTSMYLGSRNQSYLENTLPQVDSSSVASTPMAMRARLGGDKGPLQDGNQLSLREQENVIDRIEKENFGLKLKIHFLEEALRKAGPGFSEAALKENTELKVDKVTMQRELHRYKKHLTSAERDLESYRQQMLELQEKAKRKFADESQRAEMDKLRRTLEDREADIEELNRRIQDDEKDQGQVEKLQDDIGDLEADLREKDRLIGEREDELEDLRDKLDEADDKVKDAERKVIELEQADQQNEELEEAKDTIQDLEQNARRLEQQLDEMREKMEEAATSKDRAERDLEELQEEMADKSVVTKGLSRQIDEKVTRLQDELDKSGEEYATLEKELTGVNRENDDLQATIQGLRKELDGFQGERKEESHRVQELEAELLAQADEKDLLQSRHDALTNESESLQHDVDKLGKEVEDLEKDLEDERAYTLEIEKDLRNQYSNEIERLNDEVSDLQAEIREKDNLYDNDSEKWETEKQTLESQRERAEEKANGLQRTIDRLREAEGNLCDKKSKMQEALQSEAERHKSEEGVMMRQVDDLQDALETRQGLLTNLRNELSTVRDELRQTQIDYQTQATKVAALESEIDSLQSTLLTKSSSASHDAGATRRECERLREQLRTLRETGPSSRTPNRSMAMGTPRSADPTSRLRWQLSDATAQLESATKDKKSLQDQLSTLSSELHSARTLLAETRAERDELDGELRRGKSDDNDTLRVDQERLDLRTAKMKLDIEVRRLKDTNKALGEQRAAVEKTLEDEIEKAAEEEERLGQEILQLQTKLRQSSSEGNDASSRRTIRELERRVEDYQKQLAAAQFPDDAEGGTELSIVRRDLSDARQKELDFLQREAAHREVVKGLKRQMAELEGRVHDNETQAVSHATQDLEEQLNDLEDQKIVLEEVLDEARLQAEESAAQHDKALGRMKLKLEKAERERAAALSAASQGHNNNSHDASKQERQLRKSQAEIENLEHDVRQQQELIDGLVAAEGSLRRKLERARSERAAYRMSAEKMQRDIRRVKVPSGSYHDGVVSSHNPNFHLSSDHRRALAPLKPTTTAALDTPNNKHSHKNGLDDNNNNTAGGSNQALETVVRAAEGAEERHKKELRGMVTQMEWMHARWEREAAMRADVGYAKRFVQLQLDVAQACNKAQLRDLEYIRTNLLQSRKPLSLPSSKTTNTFTTTGVSKNHTASNTTNNKPTSKSKPSLSTFLTMARFIARIRLSARAWAKQEAVRQKLVSATEEVRRKKRGATFKVVRAEVC